MARKATKLVTATKNAGALTAGQMQLVQASRVAGAFQIAAHLRKPSKGRHWWNTAPFHNNQPKTARAAA